jgi:hypothetical protein
MKPEIENIIGSPVFKEFSSMMENFAGMTNLIEANFSKIKDILH